MSSRYREQILDSFVIASGRRKIVLAQIHRPHKQFECQVYITRQVRNEVEWVLLTTSEYDDFDLARSDFERRRPNMRDASEEVFEMPMQKGKRLVQEVFKEKLGG